MPSQTRQRSPNVLNVHDTLWFSVYGWGKEPKYIYPFVVRITRFTSNHLIEVESVPRSDDPDVTNDWVVRFKDLRRVLPPGVRGPRA